MATAFLSTTILPARDATDVKIDGSRHTTEDLTGNTPTLTVTLGATPQTVDCLWFGVDNVAKATISLDSTVIVAADDFAEKRGFASFTSQAVTTITLSVTEKTDTNKPVRVSEVVAGTLLLELPDSVFRQDLNPEHVRRTSGTYEMLGGGLRTWSTVNDADLKLDITHTGSAWNADRVEAFLEVYNDNPSFYFVRDTLQHPLDGYMAVWGNERLPTPYVSSWKGGGQNVQFAVRESD